ncbi:MAG: cell division protein FtsZ, partial [Bacillus sp. (in: firmicutes)]
NITGGTNLSLYEVQEAADIVATASDQEVNMIFGSVINETLKDEIIVTVIATGFKEETIQPKATRPTFGQAKPQIGNVKREQQKREEVQQEPVRHTQVSQEETLDIPTFLRNRNRRR